MRSNRFWGACDLGAVAACALMGTVAFCQFSQKNQKYFLYTIYIEQKICYNKDGERIFPEIQGKKELV
jgi:hypothetical protein